LNTQRQSITRGAVEIDIEEFTDATAAGDQFALF
jgi:hypothetical protein